MKIDPIIPIWLMSILCVGMICLKKRSKIAYIRQIIAIVLVFLINLRIMVPSNNVSSSSQTLDTYVLFVVDDTISMLARDYDGDTERLTAVKKDCSDIIDELDGAKFAVISFNNNANLVSPFTNNSQYAKDVIGSLYPIEEMYAEGTSMNVSIDMMTDTLKRAREKADGNVVVFFISDGEITNEEKLKSFKSAAKYVDGGAVLGYGTSEGGNMYVKSYYTDREELLEDTSSYPRKPAVSVIDEKNLKSIASDIGVKYINMNDSTNIDSTISKIKKESVSESKDGKVTGYVDIYYIFAAMLVVVMMWEFVDIRRKCREIDWRKE